MSRARNTNQASEVMELLVALETDMRRLGIWSDTPPSVEQFQSQLPFFVDTMAFEQWLQFVLIPRLTTLIADSKPLPANAAILPMAEETLDIPLKAKTTIVRLIGQLDSLLSAEPLGE